MNLEVSVNPPHILIVDDDPDIRNVLAFDLKRRNYQVSEASNGIEALDIVKKNHPDLVISDIRMPDGDGMSLLDNIKSLNQRIPPVIFVSGYSDFSLEEIYDRGADALFPKPYDRKALFRTIEKTLEDIKLKPELRKHSRIESDLHIEILFEDSQFRQNSKLLNIGRGGIFLQLNEYTPELDSTVQFYLKYLHDISLHLEGKGIVKWIRPHKDDLTPKGCGIEFTELSAQSRKVLVYIINELKVKSYIPKS